MTGAKKALFPLAVAAGFLLWAAVVGMVIWMALRTEGKTGHPAWISGAVALTTAMTAALVGTITAWRTNRRQDASDEGARRRAAYTRALEAGTRYDRALRRARQYWADAHNAELQEASRIAFKDRAWLEHDQSEPVRDDLLAAVVEARLVATPAVDQVLAAVERAAGAPASGTPGAGADLPLVELRAAVKTDLPPGA